MSEETISAVYKAPSVPNCVCANDLSFKIRVFQVVKSPHSRREMAIESIQVK